MKKSVYIILLLIILIMLAILAIKAIDNKEQEQQPSPERTPILSSREKTAVTVYYLTADAAYLLPLSYDIAATTEDAKVAMEKLLAGPTTADALDPIRNDTKLLNLYSIYDTVYIDLTADFYDLNELEMTQAVDAIVCTVMPLAGVEKFRILVAGEALPSSYSYYGRPMSEFLSYYPYLNLDEDSQQLYFDADFVAADYLPVTCYRPYQYPQYLIPFTTLMPADEAGEDQTLWQATQAVEMLLDTNLPENIFALPTTFLEFLGLTISDNIAYCDFAASLLAPFGKNAEELFLECLTRTLVAIEGIDAIQITVEGEIALALGSGSDISHILKADSLINKQ